VGGGVIHTGDCIEVMAGMDADSVDAVVTDPPYGLDFMGKEWDSSHRLWATSPNGQQGQINGQGGMETWGKRPRFTAGYSFQAWCEAWGREALRVTKPGGYLLAFGGTRTHHRLVCGLEDAGWIIRDELDWIYASGFPKGKANLKPAHEPIVLARKPGPLRPLAIDECRIKHDENTLRKPVPTKGWVISSPTSGSMDDSALAGRWPSNVLLSDPALFDEPNPEVVGSGATVDAGVAVRHNVGHSPGRFGFASGSEDEQMRDDVGYGDSGGYSRFFIVPKSARADREPVLRGQLEAAERDMNGSPVRNARCADCGKVKFSAEDARCQCENPVWIPSSTGRENSHPTVKPVDLMRHLVRLVTPSGGTVLDCFLGSGSTAIAAELEGFPWIGIEKEPEYVAIAEARLNGTQRGLGLDFTPTDEAA
jgi:DNA modification methylase